MNKLLSNKVLALSMLTLLTGESWGMNQNPPLNNSQTNMSQKIVVNILSDISLEGNMNYQTLTILARSPSYQWFKNKGVTSTKGIKIICREVQKHTPSGIAWFLCDYSQKMNICTWLDRRWSKLSPIFDLVEIRTTNQFGYKSYETKRKQEILQTWDVQNSLSAKWASQNNVDTHKDLLSLTLKAISLSGQKIDINRCTKRDNLLLLKFLDDNWDVLQPFMGQALQQIQQHVLQNQQTIQLQNQQQPQQTQNTSTQSAAVHNSNDDFFFNPPDDDYGNGEFYFNPLDDDLWQW